MARMAKTASGGYARRAIHHNPSARDWIYSASNAHSAKPVRAFHEKLEGYQATPLVALDQLARELGLGKVYVKDESSRLGLPSFKILGASWGVFRALVQHLQLPGDAILEDVTARLKQLQADQAITIVAATDGNHGRAVAHMCSLLPNTRVDIYVPKDLDMYTVEAIEGEGATVIRTEGDYDVTVKAAWDASRYANSILVQDTSFAGYEEIPNWIVDGYSTMMLEIDEALDGKKPDVVITPLGVGSLATAVTTYHSAADTKTAVVAVEPDTAACLWKSLGKGAAEPIETTNTIMQGMNCGTVSDIAWPILKEGIAGDVTVSDWESHENVEYLRKNGVEAGPCGAGALAALRRLVAESKNELQLTSESVVVLLCTEGGRQYETPRNVTILDATSITQELVKIESTNPDLSQGAGSGGRAIAQHVTAWLQHRDIETHWLEDTPGRASVVGVARGSGGGRSIMLNGHIDTVSTGAYSGDPLSGHIQEGKLYGRGAQDMKAGVAGMMVAIAAAKEAKLRGDVILAAVADEENFSIGTEEVLRKGWRADGAMVPEPTEERILIGHKGFVWFTITFEGIAAHGSRRDLGTDAIMHAGLFLAALYAYDANINSDGARGHPGIGQGSVHAGIISGGEETSSYPAKCTVTVERRTIPGEATELMERDMRVMLDDLAGRQKNYKYKLETTFERPPLEVDVNEPFVQSAIANIGEATGIAKPEIGYATFWADSALLAAAGIPAILYGVKGDGLHGKTEYAEVDSIERCAKGITATVTSFCK